MAFFDPKRADPTADTDARLHAPATARNRDAIVAVLGRVLPPSGLVLEMASGTGEHVAYFAERLPARLEWQPTDVLPRHLASIAAHNHRPNVRAPIALDVEVEPWPVQQAAAILAINLVHIAPWSACLALLRGAARTLSAGGVLFLYGPFQEHGQHTAESNALFDQRLRDSDPRWGVRDADEIVTQAAAHGLLATERVAMPANNLSLVFTRG